MGSRIPGLRLFAGAALAACATLAASGASHAAGAWPVYTKATSYTISYPAHWPTDRSHKDGTDFSVQSPDGEAWVGVVVLKDANPSTSLKAIDLAGLKGGGKLLSKPAYQIMNLHGTPFQTASAFEQASTGESLKIVMLAARYNHHVFILTSVVAAKQATGPTHPQEAAAVDTMVKSMRILK